MATSVNKPILLDETGIRIATAIEEQTQELVEKINVEDMVGATASTGGVAG